MILYHGSSVPNLKELEPYISEHKKPYIYFSNNMAVAALYTVHKIERPYNWFPYGFNDNGVPIYTEYYPNALADVYRGQRGYIYQCRKTNDMSNPTNINCAYVCPKPVIVDKCITMDDVYMNLLKYEKEGMLIIRRFEDLPDGQRVNIKEQMQQEILNYDLLSMPECSYSRFIRERFPDVWENTAKIFEDYAT